MTDLKPLLRKSTVDLIYEHHKKRGDSQPVRGYLGASIIGHPCERYLWYVFRQATLPDFSGRIYRLFETGDLAEARFTAELRAIGCEVHDHVPTSGEVKSEFPELLPHQISFLESQVKPQQFEITDFGGHFSGHMDGCVLGLPEAPKTWHVLEYKTHNNKSFKKLQKEGVKKSKPVHYAQMQVYMHKTGMKRALYLAVNKDTDELYMERVYYDKLSSGKLMERAKRIITLPEPPPRISERRDYYQCGWCDALHICHGSNAPDPALSVSSLSCRQCCHATPIIDGNEPNWCCKKLELPVSGDDPCDHHLLLPGMISFAEPTNCGTNDEGENFIEFTNADGAKWIHGAGGFSPTELRTLPREYLTNGMIQGVKESFGAEIESVERDLLPGYPSAPVWKGPSCDLFREWEKRYKEDLRKLTTVRKCQMFDYGCLEYEGARLIVAYKDSTAEIRERVPF